MTTLGTEECLCLYSLRVVRQLEPDDISRVPNAPLSLGVVLLVHLPPQSLVAQVRRVGGAEVAHLLRGLAVLALGHLWSDKNNFRILD